MKVVLIVAMDKNRGIGKDNDLMWHLPADMKFFRETTTGNVVVMGRKNFESIPEKFRPLPKRENVVLTRNTDYTANGTLVFNDYKTCLKHYENSDKTVFIIGGGEIYALALEQNTIDEMFITHVDHVFDADTFFPAIDVNNWSQTTIFTKEKDGKNPFDFHIVHYLKQ